MVSRPFRSFRPFRRFGFKAISANDESHLRLNIAPKQRLKAFCCLKLKAKRFNFSLSLSLILLWGSVFIACAQSEGAHLELHSTNLKVISVDPFTVEGDIVFENQGGAALTIRQLQSGIAGRVEVTKTSKFLWVLDLERPVNTIRVNARSTRELTHENGYNVRFTDYPSDYANPGIFSLYVDLGPANDPRWDDRGQLMILHYDKRLE